MIFLLVFIAALIWAIFLTATGWTSRRQTVLCVLFGLLLAVVVART